MNKVDLTTGFTLYLGFALLSLLVIAALHDRRRKRSRLHRFEKGVVACEFCSHEYLDSSGKRISTCPECRSHNTTSVS